MLLCLTHFSVLPGHVFSVLVFRFVGSFIACIKVLRHWLLISSHSEEPGPLCSRWRQCPTHISCPCLRLPATGPCTCLLESLFLLPTKRALSSHVPSSSAKGLMPLEAALPQRPAGAGVWIPSNPGWAHYLLYLGVLASSPYFLTESNSRPPPWEPA